MFSVINFTSYSKEQQVFKKKMVLCEMSAHIWSHICTCTCTHKYLYTCTCTRLYKPNPDMVKAQFCQIATGIY